MCVGEVLCGEWVGVDPGSVAWAVHVVEDGLVEYGCVCVEFVILLVVDEFGQGGL